MAAVRRLSDIPTKELLRMRDACLAAGPGATVTGVSRCGRGKSMAYRSADVHMGGPGFTREEIMGELATREHVPNKAEARAIRQKRASGRL